MDLARAAASVDMASEMSDADTLAPVDINWCFGCCIVLCFWRMCVRSKVDRYCNVRKGSCQVVQKEKYSLMQANTNVQQEANTLNSTLSLH